MAINETVGTNYSGWMKAGWPDGKPEYPFWIWFPKLAETKDGNGKTSPVLIFAKEPKGGPYIFRGVYIRDAQKSRYKHHVATRIGTRVKLIGQPAENIEILDDFRNK